MLVDMIPTLIACVLYLVTALLIWRRPHRVLEQVLPPVALALHGTALSVFVFRAGTITLGFNEALSLFAWQSSFLLWAMCFRAARSAGRRVGQAGGSPFYTRWSPTH